MREVAAADHPFVREEVNRAEAKRRFAEDPLKLERIDELGDDEVISVYTDGPFVDLCRGPHVPSTGKIKHFKLLHAAGAYWRGDERRQMLQRIYGTAWFSKDDLDAYLHRLEEAQQARPPRARASSSTCSRSRRTWGRGSIFWHPKGAMVNFQLRRFIEDVILERGYQLVYTPHVTREQLFLRSGHLPLYAENQFPRDGGGGGRGGGRALPGQADELPDAHPHLRRASSAATATCRSAWPRSRTCTATSARGRCTGMLRVRGLTMDDAHIFLREDQIEDEIFDLLDIVELVLGKTFGLALPARPRDPAGQEARRATRCGTWPSGRSSGRSKRRGITYRLDAGGGAFYGPKIDIKFNDAIGREWQGATIQLDYQLPERFQLEYTGADNRPHRPVMIHRAIYGTLERFVGFLIEHFAGAFPLWLAPEQVRVLPIAEAQLEAARAVVAGGCGDAGSARPPGRPQRDAELQDPRRRAAEGALPGGGGAARGRGRDGGGAGPRSREEAGRVADRRIRVRRLREEVRTRSLTPLSLNGSIRAAHMSNDQTDTRHSQRLPHAHRHGSWAAWRRSPRPKLGALVIREAVRRAGRRRPPPWTKSIMGNVLQGGVGQAPARQAAIHAGLPGHDPGLTSTRSAARGSRR